MASSQVEYAAADPFGCVLRDHNSRNRGRDTNTIAPNDSPSPKTPNSFQRNFKDLVRDHLQSCIPLSPRALSSHVIDENSDRPQHHAGGGFSCFGKVSNSQHEARFQKGNKQAQHSQLGPKPQAQAQQPQFGPKSQAQNQAQTQQPHLGPKSRAQNQAQQSQLGLKSQAQLQLGPKSQAQNQAQNQTSFITGSAREERRDPSPARSEGASSDISVSSLVQKWRGFEANHAAGLTTAATTAATEAAVDEREEKEKEERERERIRVADIVRKWPGDEPRACLARLKIGRGNEGKSEVGEGKSFSPRLVSSPRVRGRQAIVDVFMRMERERYREIELLESKQVVSKFPQRGRIQALLRLKFLRGDQTIEPPSPSKVVGTSSCGTASAVTSLREKFDSSSDQDPVSPRTPKETPNTSHQDTQRASTSASSKHLVDEAVQTSDKESDSNTFVDSSPRQISPKTELNVPSYSNNNENSEPENASTTSSKHSDDQTVQTSIESDSNTFVDISPRQISPKAEPNVPSHSNNNEETSPVNVYSDYWEQGEAEGYCYYDDNEGGQYYYEPNLDWISDIARPRSYWEDLRRAWYREVLDTKSKNEEIRQLLERGSVSNVLASDFRERMDRLIMNSVQGPTRPSSYNQVEEGSYNEHSVPQVQDDARQENTRQLLQRGCVSAVLSSDFRERMDQLVKNRMQSETPSSTIEEQNEYIIPTSPEQIEDDNVQENIEREDERSSVMHRYNNVGDFYERNSTPSPLHSDQNDHEERSPLASSYTRGTREGSSSFKNTSIEMELIYDLRSHMEQLYREMAELRKSVTSCMDMQMKMQHSTREKVSSAIIRKEQAEKKDSNRRKPKKGTCCICYEKKVDSLLYRCGHMCTCFTCANELQWGSGKCPICRAQIVDVVRAYPDL